MPDIVLPSIDDYLPHRRGLPARTRSPGMKFNLEPAFDGHPLESQGRAAAAPGWPRPRRQAALDEFTFLRKNVDWFKMRQSQKLISLNLETRRAQKVTDDEYRKAFKAEKATLAKNDFPYKEYRLGPPPPPRIKPAKKPGDEEDEEEQSTEDDDNDVYAKVDVPLRESLRGAQRCDCFRARTSSTGPATTRR